MLQLNMYTICVLCGKYEQNRFTNDCLLLFFFYSCVHNSWRFAVTDTVAATRSSFCLKWEKKTQQRSRCRPFSIPNRYIFSIDLAIQCVRCDFNGKSSNSSPNQHVVSRIILCIFTFVFVTLLAFLLVLFQKQTKNNQCNNCIQRDTSEKIKLKMKRLIYHLNNSL